MNLKLDGETERSLITELRIRNSHIQDGSFLGSMSGNTEIRLLYNVALIFLGGLHVRRTACHVGKADFKTIGLLPIYSPRINPLRLTTVSHALGVRWQSDPFLST